VHLLVIGAGGFFGAIARYLVDGFVAERAGGAFPLGTLIVNLSGAFALGVLATLAIDRSTLPAEIRGPVMIGFLGAYTTFSTWTLESLRLIEAGSWTLALANLAGSLVLGMIAVGAGVALGRAL
jgi:CrcB protein